MNPTIQLIQLTMKFEREEKAQRHTLATHSDALINELSDYLHKFTNRINHIFNPPRRQQYCSCQCV
jgi:hypothetical protein